MEEIEGSKKVKRKENIKSTINQVYQIGMINDWKKKRGKRNAQ